MKRQCSTTVLLALLAGKQVTLTDVGRIILILVWLTFFKSSVLPDPEDFARLVSGNCRVLRLNFTELLSVEFFFHCTTVRCRDGSLIIIFAFSYFIACPL